MNEPSEDRLSGGLIITASLASLALMLHHPSSLDGPDDGMLLGDWANPLVHGAMIVCLFTLRFAFTSWSRRLGLEHVSVRAGAMAFDAGMTAFIGAALISGFAAGGLVDDATDVEALRQQLRAFGAVNQALANLGMVLTAAAMAFWAVRMLRLDAPARIAGVLGLAIAITSAGWMAVGQGAFGLYPALIAVLLFGAWSILIAAQLLRSAPPGANLS
jgi:hypothetical protein